MPPDKVTPACAGLIKTRKDADTSLTKVKQHRRRNSTKQEPLHVNREI